jgi:hypothetical protein
VGWRPVSSVQRWRASATAGGPSPHDPAGRPACAPTDPCRAATDCRAGLCWAAATSCASSSPAHAQACPPVPSAARPGPPAAHSAPTTPAEPRRPHHAPGHRSPRPRPAPQLDIRQRPVMSPWPTERLQERF